MAVDPNARQWEQEAAAGTGIPFAVTHQQAIAESGETDTATSSAGAHGFWQFLASTYNPLATQAGVPTGSWNNPADETKVYILYMNQLLKQEGGSIFKALEAYNAGPGNLGAGAGYASGILSKAGLNQNVTAGTPGSAQPVDTSTAGFNIPGLPNVGSLLDPATWINDLGGAILKAFGVPTVKDLIQRLGIILFGVALVIVGIRILSNSSGGSNKGGGGGGGGNKDSEDKEEKKVKKPSAEEDQPSTEVLGGSGESAGIESVGASEAVEAAAVA